MKTHDAIQRMRGMVAMEPKGPRTAQQLGAAFEAITDVYMDADDGAVEAYMKSLTEDQLAVIAVLGTATTITVMDAIDNNRPETALAAMYYFAARVAMLKDGNDVQ